MLEQHDIPLEQEIDSYMQRGRVLDIAGRPKKRNGSPERSVQVTIKRYLEQMIQGCEVIAITNEQQAKSSNGHSQARFHGARKAAGGVWGATDLMVVCPLGFVFFVEVKAPQGRVEARQAELHERWRRKGHLVIVADGIESLRYGLHHGSIPTWDQSNDMRLPNIYYEGIPAAEARARGLIA